MQENRSFGHYFGALAGARGFHDKHAIKLPTAAQAKRSSPCLRPRNNDDTGRLILRFHSRISNISGVPCVYGMLVMPFRVDADRFTGHRGTARTSHAERFTGSGACNRFTGQAVGGRQAGQRRQA